ncbi:MAG: AMP-dependent synthetase [Promethearchaeota archaeon]|nr:MAG: AMP-dependent synthetase [Candidatus Lokiarchaeota archaeon]
MSSPYSSRFWKKNWDKGVEDLDPKEFDTTYPEMIAGTFKEYADKMAIEYLGVELTFKEIDEYSNQFANMLIDHGFKKGDMVGINLPNTPQYIIALVGTLKAGCIVSGVSPLLSAVQIQYQINDLGSGGKKVALITLDAIFAGHIVKIADKMPPLKVVITTSVASFLPKIKQILGKALGKVPKGKVTPLEGKVVLDLHKDVFGKYPTDPVNVDITPDDIGWIQYTGGTTGPPKGAMLSHRNCISNMKSIIAWLQWEMGKGILCSGFPYFHIAGLTVCESSLFAAFGQLVIPNPRDTDHIVKVMKKYHPTNLVNVPSLYQLLIKNPKFREIDHSELGTCISAASPFPKESQIELESIIGKGKLLELYGMTETSPVSTMNPSIGEKKLGTVGLPIQNVELKLVEPDTGKEVPLGDPGEICVRGPLVMQGYYNKPEETKKAIDSDGYMHTGDVGIMDEEGYIRIVDRTKDMIIVGGYKVFSSKVEDTLMKHPAIGMVALIGEPNPDRPGSEIVNAYIQVDPDYSYDGNEEKLKSQIEAFAKEQCAPYEVPKKIHIMEEIPLTAVGKIDKKVLRK